MRYEAEWPVHMLGDVVEAITVGHVGSMATEYVPHGIPFLRSQNVQPFALDLTDVVYIGEEFHARLAKSALRAGDVVIVRTGVPGVAAVVPDDLGPANCSDLVIVRPGSRFDSRFLCYAINVLAQEHVSAHLVGAVQQHFNVGSARVMRLPVPGMDEQRAIASAVGVLDEKIALNRRMNRTLLATAAAIFRSWFVDFDPVVAKAENRRAVGVSNAVHDAMASRFSSSDEVPLPEGWHVGSVKQLARFVNGRNFTARATGHGRMVIRIAELNNGPGRSTVYNSIEASSDHLAQPGDLLFSWSGSLGVYRWHRDEALVNQHIFKVVCESYPQWFVHQHLDLTLPFFREVAAGKATTMGHIKREHLAQVSIPLPPQRLLEAATPIFQSIYDRVLLNLRESLRVAGLRDALLPQLLSGALRVRDAEHALAAAV